MFKFRYRLSLREIKELFCKVFKEDFSHVSPYNWSRKFGKYTTEQNKIKISYSNVWHVDEKYIKARNEKDRKGKTKWSYLWVVLDDKGNLITTHVSHKRNIKEAKSVLKKAKERAGFTPDILVSDGLQAYKRAKRILGRKCKHIIAHFESKPYMYEGNLYYLSNNIIERWNGTFDLWYHGIRGFKSLESANLWLEIFGFYYNFLRPHMRYEVAPALFFSDLKEISWNNLAVVA